MSSHAGCVLQYFQPTKHPSCFPVPMVRTATQGFTRPVLLYRPCVRPCAASLTIPPRRHPPDSLYTTASGCTWRVKLSSLYDQFTGHYNKGGGEAGARRRRVASHPRLLLIPQGLGGALPGRVLTSYFGGYLGRGSGEGGRALTAASLEHCHLAGLAGQGARVVTLERAVFWYPRRLHLGEPPRAP